MNETWGMSELHENWPAIEDEIARSALKMLFGFWVTIAAIAGGFWTFSGGLSLI